MKQPAMAVTLGPQHAAFFRTFGYLKIPGLLAAEIGWIDEEFDAVLAQVESLPGPGRNLPFPFIDRRRRLCELLDHPAINQLMDLLLEPDANYLGSTGGFFVGDTPWHRDGFQKVSQRLKVALYLTEVGPDNGCLRLVPSSHALGEGVTWPGNQLSAAKEVWGIEERDVPSVPLPSKPGDVIVFDQTILHASFGGTPDRRMFTMHFGRHCHTPEELIELEGFVATFPRFGISRLHSNLMRSTASPARMRRLEQPIQVEHCLRGVRATAARYRFRREIRRARRLPSPA